MSAVTYHATVNDVQVGAQSLKALERAVKQEEARQAKEEAEKKEKDEKAYELSWASYGRLAYLMLSDTHAKPWFIRPSVARLNDYYQVVRVENYLYGGADFRIGTEYTCEAAVMTVEGTTLAIRTFDPYVINDRGQCWLAIGCIEGSYHGNLLPDLIAHKLEAAYQEHLISKQAA